jgi:2-hydroxycyclohexanecarboxyl-CoA dehydrogenase
MTSTAEPALLRDRVAIVTGAASGIGRAIALAMAAAGARVAIADLNEAGAVETASTIVTAAGQAQPYQVDVTRRAVVEAMVSDVVTRWGTVHILVNNAGWDHPMAFVDTTEEFWDKVLGINLKGPLICTKAVLPAMIAQKYGKIVSVASDAGRVGSTGEAVYSAAKGGIIAFTKTMAREVARYQVNVNCVCPGPSDTPLFRNEFAAASPKLAESLKRVIPWGRLGTAEDVAPAVVFLASDGAGFITGQTLSVSGGLTMI